MEAMWNIIRFIKRRASSYPEKHFKKRQFTTPLGPKDLIRLDDVAEVNFESLVMDYKKGIFKEKLIFWGEESFDDPELNLKDVINTQKIGVLMDLIDGTDLFVRMLSNWCSAVIFFKPESKEILASLVGLPSGKIYGWCPRFKQNPFWVKPTKPLTFNRLRGPNRNIKRLENASICFYGQKSNNLLSLFENKKFIDKLKDIKGDFRIYNLGGNPMMIRLAEGDIDAVIELRGQAPHDVAPGAYIAQKAGAVFRDLKGKDIKLEELLLKPAHPKSKIKYILASTDELYWDIQHHLINS